MTIYTILKEPETKYQIHAIIWIIFSIIGAFVLKDVNYTYFSLTIASIWYASGTLAKDIKDMKK